MHSLQFGVTRRFCVLSLLLPIVLCADDRKDHKDQSSSLGTFVVVGDSLSAGFQNFSLNDTSQPHGFAAVVASQANANVPLPLFTYPGIPPALAILPTGQIVRAPGIGVR